MPVDKLIGTIVAERIIDLVCLLVVIILTVFSQIDRVGSYAAELLNKLSSKANDSITILVVISVTLIGFAILFYKFFNKNSWFKPIKSFFLGIKEGIFSIQKIKRKKRFLFYTLAIWFLYLLSIRIGFYSMAETVDLGWVPSLTILTFGSFAMIATQGGVGAYQFAVQKTLEFYGIHEITGLAFGWLLWSVQTFSLLIVGPISILLLYLINKRKI